jgi:C-terminal processing protease CtpA/Prc
MRRIPMGSSLVATVLSMAALVCSGGAIELPPAMVEQLNSEQFAVRQGAEAELLKWSRQQPGEAMDELYRQSRVAPDPEVRERCLRVLKELINDEYLREGVGYLGVRMNGFTEVIMIAGEPKPRFAIRLIQVEEETPARKAGLIAGDLLLGVNDTNWTQGDTSETVSEAIQSYKAGTEVKIKLFRDGKVVELPVVLGRRPAAADLLRIGGLGLMPAGPEVAEAAEKVAREAYLRRWLARKKAAAK